MDNPVVIYLKKNNNSIYSVKTLAKRLQLSIKKINYYCKLEESTAVYENREPEFKRPKPLEVGSNHFKLNIVKFNHLKPFKII